MLESLRNCHHKMAPFKALKIYGSKFLNKLYIRQLCGHHQSGRKWSQPETSHLYRQFLWKNV